MRLRHFSWDVLPSPECGACKTALYLLPRHSIPLLGELLIRRKQSTDSWVYFSSRWSKWVPGPPPAPSQAAPQNSAVLVCNVFVLLSAVTEPALFIWITGIFKMSLPTPWLLSVMHLPAVLASLTAALPGLPQHLKYSSIVAYLADYLYWRLVV